MTQQTNLLEKIFADKNGRIVILQLPNWPLVVWFALLVASRIASNPFRLWLSVGSILTLAYWSVLEIGWGVSLFRRVFGLIILIGIVCGIVRMLSA